MADTVITIREFEETVVNVKSFEDIVIIVPGQDEGIFDLSFDDSFE